MAVHVILPLPVSKNERVVLRRKEVWEPTEDSYRLTKKKVVRNSEAWKDYIKRVYEIINYFKRIVIPHPKESQRLVLECRWFLKNDRQDCINFHDLLADALKDAIDIDDKWFLIRDRWAEVDKENPRVEMKMFLARAPK